MSFTKKIFIFYCFLFFSLCIYDISSSSSSFSSPSPSPSSISSADVGPSSIPVHGIPDHISLYEKITRQPHLFSIHAPQCMSELQDWTDLPFVTLDSEETGFKEDAFYVEKIAENIYLLAVAIARYSRLRDNAENKSASLDLNKEQISYVTILILDKTTGELKITDTYFAQAVIQNTGPFICSKGNILINPCIEKIVRVLPRGKIISTPVDPESCELIRETQSVKTLYYNSNSSEKIDRAKAQKDLLEQVYILFKSSNPVKCFALVEQNILLSKVALKSLHKRAPLTLTRNLRGIEKIYDMKEFPGQKMLCQACGWSYDPDNVL